MNINLYFLHKIISRLGSKITSFVIIFMLMANFPKNSLTITIFLFSIDSITNILFSKFYGYIVKNVKNIKLLVLIDILAAINVISIFVSFNNIYLLISLYIVYSIIINLISRLDIGLFYKLTKNTPTESKQYQISGSIDSILSLIAPALTTILITYLGNRSSLLLDSASFFIGALLYYLVIQHIDLKSYSKDIEKNTIETEKKTTESLFLTFKNYCNNISINFKKILFIYMLVALVTNVEEPLIFNYLSLERGFSKDLIGISFSLSSVGMFLGSRIYSFIENKNISLFYIVTLDAICSFLLSFNINRYLIIFLYIIQGIMAMLIMITFSVNRQKEFDNYENFLEFKNVFLFVLSFINLFSYISGIVMSKILLKGSLMFKIISVLEFLGTAIILILLKINHERKLSHGKQKRKSS